MKNSVKERDKAWSIAVSWISALLVPPVIIFLALRIVANGLFLNLEYHLPHFPADSYGFTTQDRLEYATLSVRYLNTRADIGLLGNLEFADGSPVFNTRELSHMQDVKSVYVPFTNLGIGSMLGLIIMFMIARHRPWKTDVIRGIRRGGWLTIGLVAAIGILAVSDFWTFFEKFHALFFEGDSWLFYYSDTLIRLFPLQFWQDIVLVLLLIIAGTGLAFGLAVRPGGKPKAQVGVIV